MDQTGSAPARPLWERIQIALAGKGWSASRLERESGVPRQTVARWKLKPGRPQAGSVKQVAEALDLNLEEALRLAGILTPDTDARVRELEAALDAQRQRNTELEEELEQYRSERRDEGKRQGKAG